MDADASPGIAKAYIGAKIIQAEPEKRDGKDGYKVIYPDGYESWSPKATFEEAYRPVSVGEARLIVYGSDDVVEAALAATEPRYNIDTDEETTP